MSNVLGAILQQQKMTNEVSKIFELSFYMTFDFLLTIEVLCFGVYV